MKLLRFGPSPAPPTSEGPETPLSPKSGPYARWTAWRERKRVARLAEMARREAEKKMRRRWRRIGLALLLEICAAFAWAQSLTLERETPGTSASRLLPKPLLPSNPSPASSADLAAGETIEDWEEVEETAAKKKIKKPKKTSSGRVWVEAHDRADGTHVKGHWRAAPGQGR